MNYTDFLQAKESVSQLHGFKPLRIPDYLFDFQKALTEWSIRKGRTAIFADCGLGKSVMELVWATNVVQKTHGRVLLLTPIAVGTQMIEEAVKFGIDDVKRSRDGSLKSKIVVANYERLHYFDPNDFTGIVCDEAGCLKAFAGVTRKNVNIFTRKIKYRLLATATPAPNDFIELGTTSEALGQLRYMDMLEKFFKNDQNNIDMKKYGGRWMTVKNVWRLKRHAHESFWRWVTSWSRSVRKPSDLGFDDDGFILPKLLEVEHELDVTRKKKRSLFVFPASGLKEVQEERRATIQERCEAVAKIANCTNTFVVAWCNLNLEGDLLEKIIPDAVQVCGSDSDEAKEEKLVAFSKGKIRVLITKPKIGGFGLNWQHCHRVTFFPNYSYEQYYQTVRRCWRFGQKSPVTVDLIYTRGDRNVIRNLRRKQQQADNMFTSIVREMNNSLNIRQELTKFDQETEIPKWI
jgi:superfamily II DNA or RNA helicase